MDWTYWVVTVLLSVATFGCGMAYGRLSEMERVDRQLADWHIRRKPKTGWGKADDWPLGGA